MSTNFREGGELINSNWPTANGTDISSGSYDLSVELRHDDMGREGGGDEDQEAELEEGHEGREGGPGDSHDWDNDESSLWGEAEGCGGVHTIYPEAKHSRHLPN